MADPKQDKVYIESHIGISLEDPQVIQAVQLFEARNKLVDRMMSLHDVISRLLEKSSLSQDIKNFVDKHFTKLVGELQENVLKISPKGEPVVRQLAVMRQQYPPEEHVDKFFLPEDRKRSLYEAEQELQNDQEMHDAQPWIKRSVFIRPLVTRPNAVRAHERAVAQHVAETHENVASFLVAARPHWNDQVFQEYARKLSEIEELAEMAQDIDLYRKGGGRSRAVALEAESCELSFNDFIQHPQSEQFAKLKRGVEKMRALADFRPEDIALRVAEWKLRLNRDLSDAVEIIEARHATNPTSVSTSLADVMREVQVAAADAVEWLDGIVDKITNDQIKPELHYSILKLLSNQKAMMEDPKIVVFYAAVKKLEDVGKPPEPKRLVTTETPRLIVATRYEGGDVVKFSGEDPFEGRINETEARRLGLEKVEIDGNLAAQDLMARIFDRNRADKFDVSIGVGVAAFIAEWTHLVPNIPPPCTIYYSGYINALQSGRVISNLDKNNPQVATPHFGKASMLCVMNYSELDYNSRAFQQITSPLLKELGLGNEVVRISRTNVDKALWTGDPSFKQKSPLHTSIIQKLDLDPRHYCFRLIAQDEYARLAGQGKILGKSDLWTWFNNYIFEGESLHGPRGGNRGNGGASNVDRDSLGTARESLAVRLVLECNK